jgi:hypothetical protein
MSEPALPEQGKPFRVALRDAQNQLAAISVVDGSIHFLA